MSAPTPSQPGLPALEAAIVATEQVLSERLAHLAWCGSVGRDTAVAETLVRSAELPPREALAGAGLAARARAGRRRPRG